MIDRQPGEGSGPVERFHDDVSQPSAQERAAQAAQNEHSGQDAGLKGAVIEADPGIDEGEDCGTDACRHQDRQGIIAPSGCCEDDLRASALNRTGHQEQQACRAAEQDLHPCGQHLRGERDARLADDRGGHDRGDEPEAHHHIHRHRAEDRLGDQPHLHPTQIEHGKDRAENGDDEGLSQRPSLPIGHDDLHDVELD
jgi:hypothetical protein